MPTWKFTAPVRRKSGREAEFVGEVDAPDASAAQQAVAYEVLKAGHVCGPVKLKPKKGRS
ncbi:hypothetical protein BGM19_07030 [Streptomyces agglomeratus]|uniref:hypothetical protein n=1 Tax=Streptomyces agglomeratus TaxID=285458 RepID=UPI00086D2329|nr:hypothetical protein [Streptomyces agglomeratus]OEJ57758.1 hypothetical protein BGM19_07030 [Streptomyces agglomeratus]